MRAVVAVDENWAIGCQGQLLFHISADLKRFKELTLGHPVILGRKTLSTFPGGRPLPGRRNLILSRDPSFTVEGAEVFSGVSALLNAKNDDAIVIGGSEIYKEFLKFCDTVYVTKVLTVRPADVWFPDLDASPQWETAEEGPVLEENGLKFRYVTYQRRGAPAYRLP